MSAPMEQPLIKRRILVADDNLDAASSLGMLLEMMGHQVCIVHDGVKAVERAATFHPDIILLDLGMPQLNGYEACARIREQPSNKKTLIVALTGWTQDDKKQRSQQAGFDFHLIKPVELPALEKLLRDYPPNRS
jgi:CheY-like chemotaxis protein